MTYDPPVGTGNLIDIATGLVALGAVVAAVVYGHRNVRVADKALRIADHSSTSSRQSAQAAKQSAEAADRVAHAELERDHETRRPDVGGARFVWGPGSQQPRPFMYKFRVDRGYVLTAYAVYEGGASRPLEFKRIVSQAEEISIQAAQAGNDARPARLRLLFWPPEPGSAGEQWTCPCGRPLFPPGDPHWEMYVDLPAPTPSAVF
jgi:hypothetical protein